MKVSKKIIDKIVKDNHFSLMVADILNIRQKSAIDLARRKSDKLAIIHLVNFYKSEGFTDEEIFEEENKNEQRKGKKTIKK